MSTDLEAMFSRSFAALAGDHAPATNYYDPVTHKHWVRPWRREHNPDYWEQPFVLMEKEQRWLLRENTGDYENSSSWQPGNYTAVTDFGLTKPLYTTSRYWAGMQSMGHGACHMLWGPYCELTQGHYEAYFLVGLGDDSGNSGSATIDITNNNGASPYPGTRTGGITKAVATGAVSSALPLFGATAASYPGFAWYHIPFSLGSTTGNLEFRCQYDGLGAAAVAAIQVWRVSPH